MCGQLGHVNSPVTVPQQTKVQQPVSHVSSFSQFTVFHMFSHIYLVEMLFSYSDSLKTFSQRVTQ